MGNETGKLFYLIFGNHKISAIKMIFLYTSIGNCC